MSSNVPPAAQFKKNTIGYVLAILHLIGRVLTVLFMLLSIAAKVSSTAIISAIPFEPLKDLLQAVLGGLWWPLIIKVIVAVAYLVWAIMVLTKKDMFASGNLWLKASPLLAIYAASLIVVIYNFTQGERSYVGNTIDAVIHVVYYLGFAKFNYSKPWLPATPPQMQYGYPAVP